MVLYMGTKPNVRTSCRQEKNIKMDLKKKKEVTNVLTFKMSNCLLNSITIKENHSPWS